MEWRVSNKDRLPQGSGSRAAKDGMFCESLFETLRFIAGAPSINLNEAIISNVYDK